MLGEFHVSWYGLIEKTVAFHQTKGMLLRSQETVTGHILSQMGLAHTVPTISAICV